MMWLEAIFLAFLIWDICFVLLQIESKSGYGMHLVCRLEALFIEVCEARANISLFQLPPRFLNTNQFLIPSNTLLDVCYLDLSPLV